MHVHVKVAVYNKIDKIDDRLYSSFIEHMGRTVYHGIYEPTHPTADESGFRQDVMDLVRPLNIPMIRYPGGNFVSGYEWEGGIGLREKRQARLDPAWHQAESNDVGTDEFHEWAKKANTGVMMAINLGSRGMREAAQLLEYCNFPGGTKYADMRVENGHKDPYNDKVWCLGNEIDTIAQIGNRTADDYGDIVRKTGSLMKMLQPDLELVACGSTHYLMDTFGEWEYTVLDKAYDFIDYLSLHRYCWKNGDDSPEYLGCAKQTDLFIDAVASMCDAVGGMKRTKKKIHLSFDEWNVWNKLACDNNKDLWKVGPAREEYIFNMEDALVFATMMITLIRHCDRVKMACLAQLVNVCAPIMTENNGIAWRQTTYYPFLHGSNFGRGEAIELETDAPTYIAGQFGEVSYLCGVAVCNDEKGEMTLFLVNRSMDEDMELNLEGLEDYEGIEYIRMTAESLNDSNTAKDPDKVTPVHLPLASNQKVNIPKVSWNVLRYKRKSNY